MAGIGLDGGCPLSQALGQAGSFSPGGVLFEIPPPEVTLSPAGLTGQPWGPGPRGSPPLGLALFEAHLPLGRPQAAAELAPVPDALCWAFANLQLYPSTADNDGGVCRAQTFSSRSQTPVSCVPLTAKDTHRVSWSSPTDRRAGHLLPSLTGRRKWSIARSRR